MTSATSELDNSQRFDFENFDLIYAMDKSNYQNIIALAQSSSDIDKVKMILDESHPGEKNGGSRPILWRRARIRECLSLVR